MRPPIYIPPWFTAAAGLLPLLTVWRCSGQLRWLALAFVVLNGLLYQPFQFWVMEDLRLDHGQEAISVEYLISATVDVTMALLATTFAALRASWLVTVIASLSWVSLAIDFAQIVIRFHNWTFAAAEQALYYPTIAVFLVAAWPRGRLKKMF